MKIEFNKLKSEDKRYVLTNKKNYVIGCSLVIALSGVLYATIGTLVSTVFAAGVWLMSGIYFTTRWKKLRELEEEYLKYAAKENIVDMS